MNKGIILYGPPAAGKDTITACLRHLSTVYVQFPRLKAGAGRTAGYRLTTDAALDELSRKGLLVWENARYEARYAVDLPELETRLLHHVPVLHLGQVPAVDAVKAATPDAQWLLVSLWCPRPEAERRIRQRATGDTQARLRAWNETATLPAPDLALDTSQIAATDAAYVIHERLMSAERDEAGLG